MEWIYNIFGDPKLGSPYGLRHHALKTFFDLFAEGKRSPEFDYLILHYLALNGPTTPYELSKDLDTRYSSLRNALIRLENDGFIRRAFSRRWRTGLAVKKCLLTSIGLSPVFVFCNRFCDPIRYMLSGHPPREAGRTMKNKDMQARLEKLIRKDYLELIIRRNSNIPLYEMLLSKWEELDAFAQLVPPIDLRGYALYDTAFHQSLFEYVGPIAADFLRKRSGIVGYSACEHPSGFIQHRPIRKKYDVRREFSQLQKDANTYVLFLFMCYALAFREYDFLNITKKDLYDYSRKLKWKVRDPKFCGMIRLLSEGSERSLVELVGTRKNKAQLTMDWWELCDEMLRKILWD